MASCWLQAGGEIRVRFYASLRRWWREWRSPGPQCESGLVSCLFTFSLNTLECQVETKSSGFPLPPPGVPHLLAVGLTG